MSIRKMPPTYFDCFSNNCKSVMPNIYEDAQDILDNTPYEELIAIIPRLYSGEGYNKSHLSILDYFKKREIPLLAKTPSATLAQFDYLWANYLTTPNCREDVTLEYFALLNFILFGKKTFYFSDALSGRLLETEINTTVKHIRLPFNSCMFVYKSKEVINAFYGNHIEEKLKDDGVITVFLSHTEDAFSDESKKLLLTVYHSSGNSYYGLHQRVLSLTDLEASLEDTVNKQWPDSDMYNHKFIASSEGHSFFRFILNSILYLGSADPEIRMCFSNHNKIRNEAKKLSEKNRKKKLNKLNQESALDYSLLGESVPPIYVSGEKTQKGSSSKEAGLKNAYQFMVRGHWRNQAHGKGRKDRKYIWIQPYLKGQDMAEILDKPYIVT